MKKEDFRHAKNLCSFRIYFLYVLVIFEAKLDLLLE